MVIVLFVVGLVLLIAGAELLVRGASRIALLFGVSPLVIGLTVVAYGTSSPELAVTVQGAFTGQHDIVLGNIIGSNILNILLVLGLAAIISPVGVTMQVIRREVPLVVVVSVTLLVLALDGSLGRLDGLLLVAGGIIYSALTIYFGRKEAGTSELPPGQASATEPRSLGRTARYTLLIVVGLGMLALGAEWLVNGAVALARFLGTSELIIGLTVIALGTSLPEIATSLLAAARGERDMAVGNVLGSNISNILLVLGITLVISPLAIEVPTSVLAFDIPLMIAVAVVCLPVFFVGCSINRWEGVLFLGYYAAYTLYLVLDATQHRALPVLINVMLWVVIPVTVLTLLVMTVQGIRSQRAPDAPDVESGLTSP